ncbi:hypothetical protein B0H13DRAFT_2329769 [Mycena leptocephala]|nr:hypothetical protein B0H13DRAFT_2329769 [Mycena leptocephala]
MADDEKRLPTVTAHSSGGDIIIRQFQSEDAPQIHALLVEGFIYGLDSPRNTALRRSLSSPISCVAYLSFLVGLSGLCTTNPALRIGETTLALGAIGVFIYLRHSITKMFVDFCASARATDMADMARSYDVPVLLPLLADGRQMRSPDEKTKGQPVVGYLGLDHHATADPTCSQLRHLIVSSHHRRRKIGTVLINAAIEHARSCTPPLGILELEVSEFEPEARSWYERLGFSVVAMHRILFGLYPNKKLNASVFNRTTALGLDRSIEQSCV